MSETPEIPTYYHPDTFVKTPFPEELLGVLQKMHMHISSIRRMTYRGATLLLSDEEKTRIKDLDDSIKQAWPENKGQVSPVMNLSSAQYLLEFAVLSPDDLIFLLHTYKREQALHSYLYDTFGGVFHELLKREEISPRMYAFFYFFIAKSHFFGGFAAEMESEGGVILDSYEQLEVFSRKLLARLKLQENDLRTRWETPQWLARNTEGDFSPQELKANFYDLVKLSLERAISSSLNKEDGDTTPYTSQEGYFFAPREWKPESEDDVNDEAA